jgi:hypothetical protein
VERPSQVAVLPRGKEKTPSDALLSTMKAEACSFGKGAINVGANTQNPVPISCLSVLYPPFPSLRDEGRSHIICLATGRGQIIYFEDSGIKIPRKIVLYVPTSHFLYPIPYPTVADKTRLDDDQVLN